MSFSTCELMADAMHQDGFSYKVTIETGVRGVVRLNVICEKPDNEDIENSQGVDMSPTECRALAKMLMATALLVDNSES